MKSFQNATAVEVTSDRGHFTQHGFQERLRKQLRTV